MTPTLQVFVEYLTEFHGDRFEISFSPGPPPIAIIPARDKRVGDMRIYDDGDELTVAIGNKHHTHISTYYYDRYPEEDRLRIVARDTAEFVNDVLCDRVCITVHSSGDRVIGSSHYYIDEGNGSSSLVLGIGDGGESQQIRLERYLWSGPID